MECDINDYVTSNWSKAWKYFWQNFLISLMLGAQQGVSQQSRPIVLYHSGQFGSHALQGPPKC
jgi:hypothetical protein